MYEARLYHEAHGLKIVRCRPFFVIGPRKQGDVASDLARGVVAIEQGRKEDLPIGNLDVVRDLLDVRDGVEALWLLARYGRAGDVYNICSGTGCNLREILSVYREFAKVEIHERLDSSLLRPVDEMVKVGSPAKLQGLGWSPKWPIRQTLEDILEYWRGQEEPEPREG